MQSYLAHITVDPLAFPATSEASLQANIAQEFGWLGHSVQLQALAPLGAMQAPVVSDINFVWERDLDPELTHLKTSADYYFSQYQRTVELYPRDSDDLNQLWTKAVERAEADCKRLREYGNTWYMQKCHAVATVAYELRGYIGCQQQFKSGGSLSVPIDSSSEDLQETMSEEFRELMYTLSFFNLALSRELLSELPQFLKAESLLLELTQH